MTRPLLVLALQLCFLLYQPALFAAGKPWTEIRSPHFRVLTNGSTADAREVASEFEQLRNVFAARFPGGRLDTGAPLLVLAVRDEATAKELEPHLWKTGANRAGEFHHGWERQFAIVRLDSWGGEGSKEVVYHEYTHTILHMNLHYLPLWLDEGTAEFYAYTRFQAQVTYLGAPTERYRIMRGQTPIPVETFIGLNSRSPYYLDGGKNQLYYAEAWALVHYLIYGKDMQNGKLLNQFTDLLQRGTEQKQAFQQVFGDFKKVDKGLDPYILQPTFTTTILRDLPKVDEKAFAVRTTSTAETEAELGIFHVWTHDLSGAHGLIEQALREDPKLGLAHESMGFLDFAEGRDPEALQEFTQAFALDSSLHLSQFYKTMLSPQAYSDSVSDMNDFGAALGKAIQLKPDFAPPYVQLAKLALREGDLSSALQISRKAEELEPSLAGYHVLTGEILRRMGKTREASDYAKFVADRWVGPDHDEAVELWNRMPAGERPALEAARELVQGESQTAVGTVKSVACGEQDNGAFVIEHEGRALTFHRKAPFFTGYSDTIWYGGDHFNLCRHLEGVRAVIQYRAPSDSTYAGDIVEIGIRDDMPQTLGAPSSSAKQ